MPSYQFEAYVAWPGGKVLFFQRPGSTANEAGPSTFIDEEFNIELDELIRRED